jgi:hypothetical protein
MQIANERYLKVANSKGQFILKYSYNYFKYHLYKMVRMLEETAGKCIHKLQRHSFLNMYNHLMIFEHKSKSNN